MSMVASGVDGEALDAVAEAGCHFFSVSLFAGLGSRYTDFAASLPLRRGTRFSSRTLETRSRGGDWMSGGLIGTFSPAMNSGTKGG